MRRNTLPGQIVLGLALGLGLVVAIEGGVGGDDCGWGLHLESQSDGGVRITSGGCPFEADFHGDFAVDDAETRVTRLGDGARVLIEDMSGDHRRRYEATAGPGGTPAIDYRVDGKEAAFDADAEAWLAVVLPRALRETGADLEARVDRLWTRGGLDEVLDEARRIGPDSQARAYLEAARRRGLDPNGEAAVLRAAGRSIGSDSELAEFLSGFEPAVFEDPEAADALVVVAESIGSDQALHRTLATLLSDGAGPGLVEAVIRSADSIGSDAELSDLVIELAEAAEGPLPQRLADVLPGIGSDTALARALRALLARPQLADEAPDAWLEAGADIGSDSALGDVLYVAAEGWPVERPLPQAFFSAAETIGSDSDLARVLRAVIDHHPLTDEELGGLLRVSGGIGADSEQASVLTMLVERYPEVTKRPGFDEAFGSVGSRSEQDRVLAATEGRLLEATEGR